MTSAHESNPLLREKRTKGLKTAFAILVALFAFAYFFGPSLQHSSTSSDQTDRTYPLLGQMGTVKGGGGVIGCWSKETFEQYGRLVRARDLDAAEKFAFTYSMNGQCRLLDNGLRVRVEEMPFFNDNFCVRPAGEIHCLWTNKGWVQRDFQ